MQSRNFTSQTFRLHISNLEQRTPLIVLKTMVLTLLRQLLLWLAFLRTIGEVPMELSGSNSNPEESVKITAYDYSSKGAQMHSLIYI
jgi:hypothetical protein